MDKLADLLAVVECILKNKSEHDYREKAWNAINELIRDFPNEEQNIRERVKELCLKYDKDFMDKIKFKNLLDAQLLSPEDVPTCKILQTNGRISLIEKEDGTYCLRNENSGDENGHFRTYNEALENWKDIIEDDNP